MDVARLLLATNLLLLAIAVAALVNANVRDPYMDEIFHIPQAQRYCNGNWSFYDPKLTTPPGLYIASVALLKPLSQLLPNPCSPSTLRFTNILFHIGTFFVLGKSIDRIRGGSQQDSTRKNWVEALTISFFPISYFFHFLYYTDSGSTFFTLLAFLWSLEDWHIGSAAASLVAMTFRQTNVIWMLFGAGTAVIRVLSDKKNPVTKGKLSTELSFTSLFSLITLSINHLIYLIPILWPYISALGFFAGFIVWNGGIVLGDKTNHIAQLHVVQLFYFSAFSAFFLAPTINIPAKLKNFSALIRRSLKSPTGFVTLAALPVLAYIIISKFTIEHPFLLADNRHYTFYLWKLLFRTNAYIRYALIPGYLVAIYLVATSLASPALHTFLYAVCVALTLVPSPLLEFRYFLVPYLIARVYVKPLGWVGVMGELVLYMVFNVVTIWVFVAKGFKWEGVEGVQRFMY
ncbi:glucosyltransferase [Rhizoclosmatium sp. JEL0117]|nr:glucosyltransferase [Rhizoclosmatium sp. JEL0117]